MRTCVLLLTLLCAIPVGAEEDRGKELVERGELLLAEGRFKKAAAAFRKAIRQADSGSFAAAFGLARAELGLGRANEARKTARTAVDLAGSPAEQAGAYNLLGIAHYQYGKARGLLRSGEESIEPTSAAKEAEAAFRKVLELAGDGAVPTLYSLAEVLYIQGRVVEARAELERYLDLAGPRSSPEATKLAQCLAGAKDQDRGNPEVTAPKALSNPTPGYNERARRARVEGTVWVVSILDENGKLVCPRVAKGLPSGLTEATLKTLADWEFTPAQVDGAPVKVWYAMWTTFDLD